MAKAKKRSALSAGRPPYAHRPAPSMKSQAARKLINTTHQLNKTLARALASHDTAAAAAAEKQLADLGGLQTYQQASIQGQSSRRGGDSSAVLLDFLGPAALPADGSHEREQNGPSAASRPRLLEIGALSTKNACARAGRFDLTRIDLHAQAPGILQQDFMQRPLPAGAAEKFDVISLSLVLNFVPSPEGRGEMLRRTTSFLDRGRWEPAAEAPAASDEDSGEALFPALFLVLPAPCLANSRYFGEDRLAQLMASLGYVLRRVKRTERIYYSLWQWRNAPVPREQDFAKREINPGPARNNFSVVLLPERG